MTRTFIIGGRVYEIPAPSVKKIMLANEVLGDFSEAENLEAALDSKEKETLAKALSLIANGDSSLVKGLLKGAKEELVEALSAIYGDIIASLGRMQPIFASIARLTAKQK